MLIFNFCPILYVELKKEFYECIIVEKNKKMYFFIVLVCMM